MLTKGEESTRRWMKQDVRNGLVARFASGAADVFAAQRLRYMVFYEELGATPDAKNKMARLDRDTFDAACDHLLIVDQRASAITEGTEVFDGKVVGTYRLLRQDKAAVVGGFYSSGEYDLSAVLQHHGHLKFLEVGRSCVASAHRGKAVLELLWQGIWDYVRTHRLDVLLGCASLHGTNPQLLAQELSFLHHYFGGPAEWKVNALPHLHVPMDLVPKDQVNSRAALRNLPTLIKAYLRLGAFVGEGAVVDHAFNTTDVLIVLPVSRINPKYFAHFGAP